MKKALKITGISILIQLLFRGVFFRLAIKYNEISVRSEIEITNGKLIETIEDNTINREINLDKILEITDKITKEELKFTMHHVSNDPNELINTNEANCIGYSAMFNSVANYLIRKNKLQNEIEAKHKIGKLELFGVDLHSFFQKPFFKDHDFNEITNKKTGKKIFIDPTVSDYLGIKRITKK